MLSLALVLLAMAPQEETEIIIVTRFADEVVVYSAQTMQEKRLYYWDKRVNITYRDELRQGSGAISEMRFADGTLIRSFRNARIQPTGIEGGVRTIYLKEILQAIVELGDDRTRFRLPGGAFFEGSRSHFTIDKRDEAFMLKNSGPEVLKLEGLPRDAGVSELPPGYRIVVPVLPPLDRGPTGTIKEDILSGLRVQAGDGVSMDHSSVGIVLRGTGPGDGLADIGGARILVVYGFQLHLGRGARTQQASPLNDPVPPASAVKDAPATPTAEPEGPPPPDRNPSGSPR